MKTLTLALALLVSLPVFGQQSKPPEKNGTASQNAGKTDGGVVLIENKKPSHEDTAGANDKKRAAAKPPAPQQGCPLWVWVKSRSNDNWLLLVNTLYLLATVGILLAMLKSNKHAEETYQQSKSDTETSLQLTRDAVPP